MIKTQRNNESQFDYFIDEKDEIDDSELNTARTVRQTGFTKERPRREISSVALDKRSQFKVDIYKSFNTKKMFN
jgi:hypothetical protein